MTISLGHVMVQCKYVHQNAIHDFRFGDKNNVHNIHHVLPFSRYPQSKRAWPWPWPWRIERAKSKRNYASQNRYMNSYFTSILTSLMYVIVLRDYHSCTSEIVSNRTFDLQIEGQDLEVGLLRRWLRRWLAILWPQI